MQQVLLLCFQGAVCAEANTSLAAQRFVLTESISVTNIE